MNSRSTFRRSRTLAMESLESREVLSAGAEGQYMLELINMARTNPKAAAQWVSSHADSNVQATLDYYGVNLPNEVNAIANATPVPPIGWSDVLAGTATQQSQDQVRMGVQTHAGADGSSLGQRLDRAGYTNRTSDGENAFAYAKSVDNAMEAFLVDWGVADKGHRRNILQPNASPNQYYRELGVGIVASNSGNLGPKVITVDFARQAASKPLLLGVAFNDKHGNNTYDMGEGQGGVEIKATNLATGQVTTTTSADAGGYQMSLDKGTYDVQAKVNGQVVSDDTVAIDDQNVKKDYNLSQLSPIGAQNGNVSVSSASAPITVSLQQTSPKAAVTSTTTTVGSASWGDSRGGWSSWRAGWGS